MSRRITIRLPADLVDFIDSQVRSGEAASRADVVTDALHREQRRLNTHRDIEILAAQHHGDSEDFGDLAAWATNQIIEMD
jgi:Arc/MetJ-type ribon-helix-helix transcriptional regulator